MENMQRILKITPIAPVPIYIEGKQVRKLLRLICMLSVSPEKDPSFQDLVGAIGMPRHSC